MARQGKARQGRDFFIEIAAWLGEARPGEARLGHAGQGKAGIFLLITDGQDILRVRLCCGRAAVSDVDERAAVGVNCGSWQGVGNVGHRGQDLRPRA
jgi:hypothetical protein